VSTSGKSGNSGKQDSPINSISNALALASPGDTVLVLPGTYYEQITVPRSGTAAKPIVIKAQTPGTVVVDGADPTTKVPTKKYLLAPTSDEVGDFVWVSGITFRRAGNINGSTYAAVRTQDGWRLEDVTVEKATGDGVAILGANVTLRDVTAQDNGATGIGGTRLDDSMLLDSVMRRNNTAHFKSAGAGAKFTRTEGFLVDNVDVYDNQGPGFWFDIDNIDSVIRNSAFHDNNQVLNPDGTERITGRGLFLEISGVKGNTGVIEGFGPILVENNLAYGNDAAGITVYATAYATLRGNTLVNNPIELKDKRPTPYSIHHLTITGNSFKNAQIVADRFSISDPVGRVYLIDGNTYDNGTGPLITWNLTPYSSLSSIRSDLGFEQNGKLGSVDFTPRAQPA
jgi:parallel beta-helix repeat protein